MNYFKKRHRLKLLLVLLAGLLLTFASAAYALDPPHDTLSCGSCHVAAGLSRTSGGNIDNTPQNLICDGCHNPASDTPKVTHSAKETKTGTKSYVWNTTWSYECRGCHNPHNQDQIRMYPDTEANGGAWVETGLISQVTNAETANQDYTVIETQGSLARNYKGWVVQPDTNYPLYYRIVNSTSNTLTVSVGLDTNVIRTNDQFGIAYGKMIRTEINSQRAIQSPGGDLYNSPGYSRVTPWRQVVYLLNTGMHSQSPPGAATDPQTKAICVVCHTRTKYNNIGYAIANGVYQETFDTTINSDYFDDTETNKHLSVNYTSGATSCWDPSLTGCHKPPEAGFDAGATCGDCHGDSIGTTTELVRQIKNTGDGLQSINTGSGAIIGAHPAHKTKGYSCSACHSDGMDSPDDSFAQIGNFTIDISFDIGGTNHNGGEYDGRLPADMVSTATGMFLDYQYGYDGNNFVSQNGNMQCSNVYCHAGIVNGTTPNPTWDGSLSCGACHKADSGTPSDLGKHEIHIGGGSAMLDELACHKCHTHDGEDDTHVNGFVNWEFSNIPDASTATYRGSNTGTVDQITTGNGYGQCESLYCHSNGARGIGGQPLEYAPRSWNATEVSMGCNGCHADRNTGSPNWSLPHSEHMQDYSTFSCTDCHHSVVDGNSAIIDNSLHIDQNRHVVFNSVYNGVGETAAYAGTSCSNVRCHSTGARADQSETEYYQNVSWNQGSHLGCNICHKFTDTAAAMRTGANLMSDVHIKHVANDTSNGNYNFDCSNCHYDTTTTGTTITGFASHVNFTKEVAFPVGSGAFDNQPGGGGRPAYRCENVNCHSDGKDSKTYATDPYPVWTDATSGACGTCHARVDADIVNASGKHAKHAEGNSGNYTFACSTCHQGIVSAETNSSVEPTIQDVNQHVNGTQDVSFAVSSDPYGTPSADDCSNNYCHSNGLPGTRGWAGSGSDFSSTEDWLTSPALDCGGCHNKLGDNDSGTTWSETHKAHIGTSGNYGTRFTCGDCHKDTTIDGASINILSAHVNETVDVVFNTTYTSGTGVFDDSGGVGNDFCANVKCHGTGTGELATPSWNDNITDCTACHRATETEANMGTGARQMSAAHVRHVGLDNYGAPERDTNNQSEHSTSNAIQCNNCHSATVGDGTVGTISDYNNHVNFTNDISFDITTDWPAGPAANVPVWGGSATKNCSNTYCHSDGDANDVNRKYKTVSWGDTVDCASCHGAPPPNADSPNHDVGDTNCNSCHPHANVGVGGNPSTGFLAGQEYKHLNGYVDQEGGCYNCHGQPPGNTLSLVNAANPDGISQRGEDYSQGWGAHTRHAGPGSKGYGCGTCHNGGQPTGGGHKDEVINIGFVVNSVEQGHYTYPAFTNTSFSISMGGATTNTVTGTSGNLDTRLCNNIYCHSDGGDYGNFRTYQTADWDEGSTLNCDACHGDGNNDGSGLLAKTERHVAHVNSTTYGFACFECHNDTVDQNNTITESYHVNYKKDVAFGNVGLGGDSYNTGGSLTRPNCTNTYCHSRGDDTGASATAPYTTAAWNDTAFPRSTCDGCHGGNKDAPNPIGASRGGAHGYHTDNAGIIGDNFECAECHLDTVDTGSDTAIGTGKHGNHVNEFVNISFGFLNPNGEYAGSASPMTRTPGTTPLADCTNVYCHSDGNPNTGARVYNTIAWDETFGGALCSGCHGVSRTDGAPDHGGTEGQDGANSHPAHVDPPNSFACQECHYNTTRSGSIVAGGNHLDGSSNVDGQDVAFNPSNANVSSGTYTPTAGDKSCDNTYCHGGSSTLSWGGTTTCADCHGGGTSVPSLPGSHNVHYANGLAQRGDFDNPVIFSDSGNYNFSCNICHDDLVVTHVGGEVQPNEQAGEVSFAAGYATDGDSYIANSTHEVGLEDNGLAWTAGNNCNNTYCHSDARGGLGASDPRWGQATGLLDCGGCHSATGGSTPHAKHITAYSSNTDVADCNACHALTVSNGTDDIADKTYHVNMTNDVSFDTWVDDGNAGYTQGSGCDNTYCHSGGTTQTAPQHSIQTWSGNLDCSGCHNTGTFNTVHAAHIDDSGKNKVGFDISCTECHNATASDNTSITSVVNHVNKTVTIRFDDGNGLNLDTDNPFYDDTATTPLGYDEPVGDGAGTGCQNVYCHSDGNTNNTTLPGFKTIGWSGTANCYSCHGNGSSKAYSDTATTGVLSGGANSHVPHVERQSYSCNDCHNQTSTDGTSITGANHLNRQEDVDMAGVASYSSGTGRCSNTNCHGTSSIQWGDADATGDDYCTICHGIRTPAIANGVAAEYKRAPGADVTGVDTAQQTGTTDPQVGAHDMHLRSWSGGGDKFTDDLACTNCHNVSAIGDAGHMSGSVNFSWSPLASTGGLTPDYGVSTSLVCSNVYCHGEAMPNQSNTLGNRPGNDTTPQWNSPSYIQPNNWDTNCNQCHGFPPKDYDADHTHDTYQNNNGNTCTGCHPHFEPAGDATETNWTSLGSPFADVTNAALHVNGSVEASGCDGCHLTTGDTPTPVNQNPEDGVARLHDQTEWDNSAHKLAGLDCNNCHGGPHHPTDTPDNPWRLLGLNMNTSPYSELNNHCLDCHSTGASNPSAASVGNRLDSWHYGTLHAAGNSGGQFCFDCHDPHGDGNIFLIQKNLSKTSHSVYGYATNATADPYFIDNGLAPDAVGSYVSNTSDAGLCQLCHDTTKYFNGTPLGIDYGRGHSATYGSDVCVQCHKHNDGTSPYNDAFAASGDCDTCHGYPPVQGDGYNSVYSADSQYNGGKGKHIVHDFSSFLNTLDPANDVYGNEETGYGQCAVCHNNGTHKDDYLDVNGVTIKPQYSFDGENNPAYIGVVNDDNQPKNCFNVLCHFTRTPRWSEPGTGSLNNE